MRLLAALALLFWSTAAIADPDAFSRPLPFLSDNDRATVHLSNSLFRKSWRPAPSATTASDGLGPLYNARSCADCHFRDGRGRPPNTGERALSLLLRLAPADPIYGRQLQNNAVDGHQPEGQVRVSYVERTVMLSGGEVVRLRKPIFGVEGETYGPLAPATQLDPRLAPPVFGLGLLEAISEQDILAGADPQDRDGDGISGRSAIVDGAVGRFGWKAGQLSIANQNAKALFLDIGIGNRRHPALWGDCTTAQTECQAGPHGDSPRHDGLEVSDKVLGHLTFYLQGIAPPLPRNTNAPEVQTGARLFTEIGCAACHRPYWRTGNTHPLAVLHERNIQPYTDLLLHDMGDALAGGAEDTATAREWRTAPLWGIGLTQAVSGHAFYLHDGRARSLTEAILWHGGEAQAARDRFAALAKRRRDALLAFLASL